MTPEDLVILIDGLAGLPYGGEAVDQRAHALQAARLAAEDGADDELLVAAALHDVGRAKSVREAYPGPHEESGAAFAAEHVSERAAWLIAQHVPAKRYLVATDQAYFDGLSPASVKSLRVQGGPMSDAEVARFAEHPWAGDALRLRRWDDAAKVPGGRELPVSAVADAFVQLGQE